MKGNIGQHFIVPKMSAPGIVKKSYNSEGAQYSRSMQNCVLKSIGGPFKPLIGDNCVLINCSVADAVLSSLNQSHATPIGRPDAVKHEVCITNPFLLSRTCCAIFSPCANCLSVIS